MSTKSTKISYPAISAEIMRLRGVTVFPGYVGQILRGVLEGGPTRPLVEEAVKSLEAKAKASRKPRRITKAKAVAA